MGFWDSAANLAKEAGEGVKRFNEKSRKLQNEYQQESSEKLRRVVKSEGFFGNSAQEKAIARRTWRRLNKGSGICRCFLSAGIRPNIGARFQTASKVAMI